MEEVGDLVEAGHKAVKLRVGDSPDRDIERVAAVRKAFGGALTILVDANTGYSLEDARRAIPAHDYRSYAAAATFGSLPLAAGENHYTRFEFTRLIEDATVRILQPDVSKTGGITEALRISAMASAWKLPISPHSSMTGLNMAATIHLLASIENAGYFEADASRNNLFRDQLVSTPYTLDSEGTVRPLEGPGIGVEVDEEFISRHPVIEGPSYV